MQYHSAPVWKSFRSCATGLIWNGSQEHVLRLVLLEEVFIL